MNSLAEQIKALLSMEDVARFYGFEPNRSGFILCPFHHEDTPSLKLYSEPGRGWHCFGCGEGGSVIDFVMKLFGLSFSAAVVRINHDFRLSLASERPTAAKRSKYLKERAELERRKKEYAELYEKQTARYRELFQIKRDEAPQSPEEPISERWAAACNELDKLDVWFETHPTPARYDPRRG